MRASRSVVEEVRASCVGNDYQEASRSILVTSKRDARTKLLILNLSFILRKTLGTFIGTYKYISVNTDVYRN